MPSLVRLLSLGFSKSLGETDGDSVTSPHHSPVPTNEPADLIVCIIIYLFIYLFNRAIRITEHKESIHKSVFRVSFFQYA